MCWASAKLGDVDGESFLLGAGQVVGCINCWLRGETTRLGASQMPLPCSLRWRRGEVRNGSAVAAVLSLPAQSDVAGCEDDEAEAAATAVGSVQCLQFVLRVQ